MLLPSCCECTTVLLLLEGGKPAVVCCVNTLLIGVGSRAVKTLVYVIVPVSIYTYR